MIDPITLWSLFVGSLGLQAAFAGGWMQRQATLGQRTEEEEEDEFVTRYESRDTIPPSEPTQPNGNPRQSGRDPRMVGWEFKIVRAERDLFRDPVILKRLCEEEESAGWIMLEKLDDRRIRFKRPIALREIVKAEFLPFDPYRSHYGSGVNWSNWFVGLAAIALLILPAGLAYVLVSTTLTKTQPTPSPAPVSSPGGDQPIVRP